MHVTPALVRPHQLLLYFVPLLVQRSSRGRPPVPCPALPICHRPPVANGDHIKWAPCRRPSRCMDRNRVLLGSDGHSIVASGAIQLQLSLRPHLDDLCISDPRHASPSTPRSLNALSGLQFLRGFARKTGYSRLLSQFMKTVLACRISRGPAWRHGGGRGVRSALGRKPHPTVDQMNLKFSNPCEREASLSR